MLVRFIKIRIPRQKPMKIPTVDQQIIISKILYWFLMVSLFGFCINLVCGISLTFFTGFIVAIFLKIAYV